MHRAFDQLEGIASIHSAEFCRLLMAAAGKSAELDLGFRDREDAIAQALQFETARFAMPWFDEEGKPAR